MDIVSHAIMGGIAASPLFPRHPVAASCLMLGAALPDLDALSRLFGKRAFLRAHQTASHSLLTAAAAGALAGALLGPWAGLALFAGWLSHALLDVSNTYGITLLWPLSRRRYSLEWVFFVDGTVWALDLLALAGLIATWDWRVGPAPWLVPAWGASLIGYFGFKALLRRRAGRLAPAPALALIPSMIHPTRFLGLSRPDERLVTYELDALSGAIGDETEVRVHDAEHADLLADLPEVALMRALSPAYHLTERRERAEGQTLIWRDLRTRNMNTRFGQLEVDLDGAGQVRGVRFHV